MQSQEKKNSERILETISRVSLKDSRVEPMKQSMIKCRKTSHEKFFDRTLEDFQEKPLNKIREIQ